MKLNISNLLRILSGVLLGLVLMAATTNAQPSVVPKNSEKAADSKQPATATQNEKKATAKKPKPEPTSQSVGDDAGNYTVTSTIEFGYRGQRVDGDVNKFKSDLNSKAGPRLFDSSFLLKSKDGKGMVDTLLVTSTGWGADPYGNMRISMEKSSAYRFEGTYRRFKYYRFLDNIANPNWLFTPTPVPPNPVTGLHGFNTYTQMGDFDLTILPKNEKIRFNVGYSPERYSGPAYTNYHNGGNEFWLLSNLKSHANDFRVGADGKLGPIDWTFLQGFRRFHDDSTIDTGIGINRNALTSVAQLTSFSRQEPTHGSVNFTRASIHSLIANKLDLTGRIIYSRSTSNSIYDELLSGTNFNFRVTGWPPTPPAVQPNTTNPSSYTFVGNVKRPSTIADIGITFLATDKFRVSNTFRVEDFTIDGAVTLNDFFSITRNITGGTRTDTFSVTNASELTSTHYRKYLNTIEGDYQFNPRYSIHFGYRYGSRREEQTRLGNDLTSSGAPLLTPESGCLVTGITAHCVKDEIESNHTNAFFGGFKARPAKNWTLYFDAEHGTADNLFTRIGNYDYTNIRAKSRYAPNRKLSFNLAVITKNNANPSEIAGTSLTDFGVSLKSRTFQSNVDWMAHRNLMLNFGYNYNWVDSDAVIDYFVSVPVTTWHHFGHALYFQRNNFFFIDATARLNRRMTLYASYRLNQDDGQGNRLTDLLGGTATTAMIPPGSTSAVNTVLGGTLVNSYPINFQSPEARLSIRLNRHLDWNLGYQYYAYNESKLVGYNQPNYIVSPRAQNYHAHLPYMSLRLYIGRKE